MMSSQCPHCNSHDITEVPEYNSKCYGYELQGSLPQLVAHCNDCKNDFDPNDPNPPYQKGDAVFENQFRRK